ncbi:MAG: hypothetical protein WD534_11260 [Phycisphaeraceae bacterium]
MIGILSGGRGGWSLTGGGHQAKLGKAALDYHLALYIYKPSDNHLADGGDLFFNIFLHLDLRIWKGATSATIDGLAIHR